MIISCSKKGQRDAARVKNLTIGSALEAIDSNAFKYNWFSFRAKIDIEDKNIPLTEASLNCRSRKDSLLWISITGLMNVEGARVLVTPDSLHLLQKIGKKQYLKRPVSFLSNLIPASVGFEDMENLLAGNGFLLDTTNCLLREVKKEEFTLVSRIGTVESKLTYDNKSFRLKKVILTDPLKEQTVEVLYLSYEPLEDGQNFSMHREVNLYTPKDTSHYSIKYYKQKVNYPTKFPFKVSSKYEKI